MANRKFWCIVGIHHWHYTEPTYKTESDARLTIHDTPGTRTCQHCDKTQIQDIHCLGLNPPTYTSTWSNSKS